MAKRLSWTAAEVKRICARCSRRENCPFLRWDAQRRGSLCPYMPFTPDMAARLPKDLVKWHQELTEEFHNEKPIKRSPQPALGFPSEYAPVSAKGVVAALPAIPN